MAEKRKAVWVKMTRAERRPFEAYAKRRGIPLSTAIRMLALDQLQSIESMKQGVDVPHVAAGSHRIESSDGR